MKSYPSPSDSRISLESRLQAIQRSQQRQGYLFLVLIVVATAAARFELPPEPWLVADGIVADVISVQRINVVNEDGIVRASLAWGPLTGMPWIRAQRDEGVQLLMCDGEENTRINLFVSDEGDQQFLIHDQDGAPALGVGGHWVERYDEPWREGVVTPPLSEIGRRSLLDTDYIPAYVTEREL